MKRSGPPEHVELERTIRRGNQIRWPARFARLLGQVSDSELAARFGVALTTVVKERRRRGIPAFRPPRPPVEWTPEMLELLGEASDRDVAAELGLAVHSVAYRRRALGIPAYGATQLPPPDAFWTPTRRALLGTDVDGAVARRLGITRGRVCGKRNRLGIPPFQPRHPKVVWTRAMVRQLGRISDRRLADRFGIGEDTVRWERQRRGIPALQRSDVTVVRKPELRKLLRLQTEVVVDRTGLNEKTVRRLRADLGMAQPGKTTVWTPAALRALGRVPDGVLAERLGLALNTVRLKRNELGIRYRVTRRWTAREDDLVRRLGVHEAARATGRTARAVGHRRAKLGL